MDQESIALEILRREIAKRLRSICSDVPSNEFELMVERLARLQRKYELVNDLDAPPDTTAALAMREAETAIDTATLHGEVL